MQQICVHAACGWLHISNRRAVRTEAAQPPCRGHLQLLHLNLCDHTSAAWIAYYIPAGCRWHRSPVAFVHNWVKRPGRGYRHCPTTISFAAIAFVHRCVRSTLVFYIDLHAPANKTLRMHGMHTHIVWQCARARIFVLNICHTQTIQHLSRSGLSSFFLWNIHYIRI